MDVIGLPFSGGGLGKTAGTEKGPAKIISLLQPATVESGKFVTFNTKILDLDNSNIAKSFALIHETVAPLIKKSVLLGGDHSITHAAFKAFAENNPGAGILVFDAHLDMMQPFSVPTHENFLRQLIEDGVMSAKNVVVVGARTWDKEEYMYAAQKNIKVYEAGEILAEGIHATCDAVMAAVKDFKSLYVSIDIDVVDPAFAPGTGYPEVGGLTSRELLYFLTRLQFLKNIKMVDITEVNPDKDHRDVTSLLAIKILQAFC